MQESGARAGWSLNFAHIGTIAHQGDAVLPMRCGAARMDKQGWMSSWQHVGARREVDDAAATVDATVYRRLDASPIYS